MPSTPSLVVRRRSGPPTGGSVVHRPPPGGSSGAMPFSMDGAPGSQHSLNGGSGAMSVVRSFGGDESPLPPSRGALRGATPLVSARSAAAAHRTDPVRRAKDPRKTREARAAVGTVASQVLRKFRQSQRMFKEFDAAGEGTITYDQFKQVMRDVGVDMTKQDLMEAARRYDPRSTGLIDYNQFNRAIGGIVSGSTVGGLLIHKRGAGDPSAMAVGKSDVPFEVRFATKATAKANGLAKKFQSYLDARLRHMTLAATAARANEGAERAGIAAALSKRKVGAMATDQTPEQEAERRLISAGIISKDDFARAIRAFGLELSDAELDDLVRGHMHDAPGPDGQPRVSLKQFARSLAHHLKPKAPKKELSMKPQWGVGARPDLSDGKRGAAGRSLDEADRNKVIAPVRLTPLADAEHVLSEKMFTRFKSVAAAYRIFDAAHTGAVSPRQFRRALADTGGLHMSDDDYAAFVTRFTDNDESSPTFGKVTFNTFKNVVGDMVWPRADGRPFERPETPVLAEWVEARFVKRLLGHSMDIDDAFARIDADKSGSLSHAEFLQACKMHGVVLNGEQAARLIVRYDRDGRGQITKEGFRSRVQELLAKPTTPSTQTRGRRRASAVTMSAEEVQRMLGWKMFLKFKTVQKAFILFDADNSGSVTHEEFRASMEDLGFFMTDYEFTKLVRMFDEDDTGEITFEKFLAQVGEMIQPNEMDPRRHMPEALKHAQSVAEWVEEEFAKKYNRAIPDIDGPLRAEDPDNTGYVTIEGLVSALRHSGIGISPEEQKKLALTYDPENTGHISIDDFRDAYKRRAMKLIQHRAKLAARGVGAAAGNGDATHAGAPPPAARRASSSPGGKGLLGISFMRPSTASNTLPRMRGTLDPHSLRRPGTSGPPPTPALSVLSGASQSSRVGQAESKLSEALARGSKWKKAFRRFRDQDPDSTKAVPVSAAMQTLADVGLDVDEEEMAALVRKYGTAGGKISYVDLMRKCYLQSRAPATLYSPMRSTGVRPRGGSSADVGDVWETETEAMSVATSRSRAVTPASSIARGSITMPTMSGSEDTDRNVRHQVRRDWKELRREFHKIDRNRDNTVPSHKFKEVLEKFGLDIDDTTGETLAQTFSVGATGGVGSIRKVRRERDTGPLKLRDSAGLARQMRSSARRTLASSRGRMTARSTGSLRTVSSASGGPRTSRVNYNEFLRAQLSPSIMSQPKTHAALPETLVVHR